MSDANRIVCPDPECGKTVALTGTGKIRHHSRPRTLAEPWAAHTRVCFMSGTELAGLSIVLAVGDGRVVARR